MGKSVGGWVVELSYLEDGGSGDVDKSHAPEPGGKGYVLEWVGGWVGGLTLYVGKG